MKVLTASPSSLMTELLTAAFTDAVDIEVASSASSARELLEQCGRDRPDVVVCDSAFPDGDLAALIPRLLAGSARVLVVCSSAADAGSAAPLLLAGASGFLSTDDVDAPDVVAAVRQVAAGEAVLNPAAAAAVLRMWRTARATTRDDADLPTAAPVLTPRETEVLDALARGLPSKSIGRELGVSPKTVESHVARVLGKLGARNRAQAVARAEAFGLLGR